ncbi:MAG: tail-specific protease, partial [Armatimonadetes bacterium]|nr:tail-specific protease [Armatimonadota bacterium]
LYDDFDISMKLSLFGIGALLSSEDGYCKIVELTPGGPALLSGKLKPGDRIVGVAQGDTEFVDVIEMKLNKIVEMIRGAKGTTVRLKVIPAGSPDTSTTKVVSLVRAEVKLEEQEAKAKVFDTTGTDGKRQRLGVIELPSFYESPAQPGRPGKSATEDVRRLIGKLKTEGCEGLVLDLRRNGGGSLQEAIRLSGLFIRKGPVVQVRSSDGRESEDDDPDAGIAYDGPLVVLTSRMSASASEILAGCLQDYDRAVVVGDVSTHGKGTVQTLLGLQELMERSGIRLKRNPGAIKVTIQKFYRPSGASTQLEGVKPDIILPSLSTHLDIGEKALDNPLAWDTIPSSQFEKFHLIQSRLPELRKRSEARVGADPDFRWVREEAERLQKLRARKSVSLNEAQRLQEKKEIAERQAARVTDLKNRPETKDVVRPLALKQVDTPGLPAPVKDVPKAPRPRPGSPAPDEDDAEAAQVNAPDFTLNEARRILLDLVSLSRP